jgi:hypothetical protein
MNIAKESKVTDILSKYPDTAMVFKRHGFITLMARLQRGGTKDDTTLATACTQQGADVDKLIKDLQAVCATAPATQQTAPNTGEILINKKMKTTEVTNRYPAAKSVFVKYFGKGCFDCPAFGTEDVNFACLMHNTNADQFVKECIEAVQKEREAKGVAQGG